MWHDQDGKPLHLHTNYYEGSNTKFYGAALFRLRERDFGEIRHHGGISPAWPITYGDLEPYYTKAEHLYEVHGTRGEDPPMGHISFVGKLDAIALSAGAPPLTPGFTLDLMARHSLDFWLTSEDLPHPDNRVTLDRDGNIEMRYAPNNEAGHKRLIKTLEHALQQRRDQGVL